MEKEIKIRDFITPIKKRLWLIGLITIAVTAIVGMYSMATNFPLFQSSTRIFIPSLQPEFVNTMGVLVKDPTVLDKVVEELGLKQSAKALSGKVNFISENESQFVKITVIDSDPNRAAQIANTTAKVFTKEIGTFLGIYDARVLSEAKADPSPINDNPRHNMDIGFAIGLVLSIGVVLFLDSLDDSMNSEMEVGQTLGLPVLGSVSRITRKNLKQLSVKRKRVRGGTIDA